MSVDVAANLAAVRARIAVACERAGRPRATVTLVAVSKRHAPALVRRAYEAGHRDFAENYVQELVDKSAALADLPELRWRFIGHLQRNKARAIVAAGAAVDTVDSIRLAQALSARAADAGATVPVLLQVNVGREPQKSGCAPEGAPALAAAVIGLPGLSLRGLMTVPPVADDAERSRPAFRALRELAERLGLPELSMGMSHDLEVAVEEGATMVRVGTAVFGPRG